MTDLENLEAFIGAAQKHIDDQPVKNIHGDIVPTFKVLYGKIQIQDGIVELESVYPISKGMKVLFGADRIVFPPLDSIVSGTETFIAVNNNPFNEAEEHDFIKTLGHPPMYREVMNNLRANPDDKLPDGYFF